MANRTKVWGCANCDFSAARKGDVERHYKAAHHSKAEQEKMKWKCPEDGCDASDLQKSNLENHMMTHEPVIL